MRAKSVRTPTHVCRLTPAEQRMLDAYAHEKSLAQIARQLGVTTTCIQMRGKMIREKMGVGTLDEALAQIK